VKRPFKASKEIPELCHSVPLVMCMKANCWFNQNRLLSHLRRSFWALAIVGASLTLPSAEADPPGTATGGFNPCFTRTSVRPADGNLIVTFNVTTDVSGNFIGRLEGTELDVIHRDGTITLHGTALFAGSLNGGPSGTLLFTYTGIGNALTGHENLHIAGRQGTDGLAGVYFQGTAEGDLGGECDGDFGGHGMYDGQILFAP
jgi:hypothetical protein